MSRVQKENQKNQGGAGTPTPNAASRTGCMYKHRCMHCGGMLPCVPETLVAVASGDAAGTAALTATTAAPHAKASSTHPHADAYDAGHIPTDDGELDSVAEPEDWRNGIQETTAATSD